MHEKMLQMHENEMFGKLQLANCGFETHRMKTTF